MIPIINEYPLILLPSLAVKFGLNEAIIIQQLHYWLEKSDKDIDGHKWVYNSVEKWHEQFPFWHQNTIRNTLNKLVKSGIVIKANHNKIPFDRTMWYSIDYNQLTISLSVKDPFNKQSEMVLSPVVTPIPDTTTDTTTDKKNNNNKKFSKDVIYITEQAVDYLNKMIGGNFKTPDKYKLLIKARLKDGFVLQDFKTTVDNKHRQWINEEAMVQYLRPGTLFGPKMHEYVNELDAFDRYASSVNAQQQQTQEQETQPDFLTRPDVDLFNLEGS